MADVAREEGVPLFRPEDMDAISQIFRYHPASVAGSLLAGPQHPQFARIDAVPDVHEQPCLGERLVRFLPSGWAIRRPAESAS